MSDSSARIWPVASGVAWRVLHNYSRNPALFLPTMLFPLFFFLAFAGGLSQVSHIPGFDYPPGYTSFQFCFVLLQSAAFGGVFTGFGIARDFESGFAKRLMLAAPRRIGILFGYALAALGRWLAVVTVLLIAAAIGGLRVEGGPVDLVGLFTLALLMNAVGVLWAAGIAMRLRTMQAGPLMQLPVFLLLFFAPVYVPLDLLSGWIHGAAVANPVTYILEAVRSLMAGRPEGIGAAFLAAVALAAVLAVWGVRGLRSAERAG
jgi:ABC-2 type transport system permease protein